VLLVTFSSPELLQLPRIENTITTIGCMVDKAALLLKEGQTPARIIMQETERQLKLTVN